MAESKTARASMRAGAVGEVKKDPFDTPEKKIAELRKQREAKLAVVRYDFIDALLVEYDKTNEAVVVAANDLIDARKTIVALNETVEILSSENSQLVEQRDKLQGQISATDLSVSEADAKNNHD